MKTHTHTRCSNYCLPRSPSLIPHLLRCRCKISHFSSISPWGGAGLDSHNVNFPPFIFIFHHTYFFFSLSYKQVPPPLLPSLSLMCLPHLHRFVSLLPGEEWGYNWGWMRRDWGRMSVMFFAAKEKSLWCSRNCAAAEGSEGCLADDCEDPCPSWNPCVSRRGSVKVAPLNP